jgi:sec-independent protein translocase protein TatA
MGSFSLVHWVVLILVVILLFGRGRISDLMGDFAKGINSFKKGLAETDIPPTAPKAPPAQIGDASAAPIGQTSAAEETRR